MSICPQCRTEYPPHVRICAADGTVLEGDQPPVPQSDPNIGMLLANKYRLDALLGRGGMGAVYRATHVMLGKSVAVKMIKPDLVGSPEMARRFQREARAATSLDHPNIVAVYDLGQAEDGALYIAMEFVQGQSLKDVIRLGGPMEPTRIARLLSQVAGALAKAHGRQIVHRDLKPHNLVLTIDAHGQECIKLLDFGIAKTFEEGATELTAAGYALGTPQYMAPEQATGQNVDGRADLYALGVILYEMLVGDVPFNASSTPAILVKHMTEPPQPPSLRRPGVHPVLEVIALRCLEKDPQRRFQSAEEFGAALRGAFPHDSTPISAFGDAPTMTRAESHADAAGLGSGLAAVGGTGSPSFSSSAASAGRESDVSSADPPQGRPPVVPPPLPEDAAAAQSSGTRPTVRAPEAAAAAVPPQTRRAAGMGRLLLVMGVVAVLLLVAVAATGYTVYRTWFAGESTAERQATADEPPDSVPAMAPPAPGAPGGAAAQAADAPPRGAAPSEEPSTAPRAPAAGDEASAPAQTAGVPAREIAQAGSPGRGPVQAGAGRRVQPPVPPSAPAGVAPSAQDAEPARTLPPEQASPAPPATASPLVPAVPSVLVHCSGAAEVCGAVRTAFDQALEQQGMQSVRRADRAHVIVSATATLLDTRYDQQFGANFAVQTFSVEVSAETTDNGAAIGMPPSRTFSFDPRFGRERANENARVLAGEAVERIARAWPARRGR